MPARGPPTVSVRGMLDEALVAESVHDTGVRRLQHAYADVVNRRAWSELDQLILPGAEIVIDRRIGEPLVLVGGTQLGEFIGTSIAQYEFFEFVILNAHIVFPDGALAGTAVSRLFMSELRQHRDSGRWTTVFGLYHDRYALEAGRWWFAGRRYHSLARSRQDLEVFPVPVRPGIDVPGPGR